MHRNHCCSVEEALSLIRGQRPHLLDYAEPYRILINAFAFTALTRDGSKH